MVPRAFPSPLPPPSDRGLGHACGAEPQPSVLHIGERREPGGWEGMCQSCKQLHLRWRWCSLPWESSPRRCRVPPGWAGTGETQEESICPASLPPSWHGCAGCSWNEVGVSSPCACSRSGACAKISTPKVCRRLVAWSSPTLTVPGAAREYAASTTAAFTTWWELH